jgi:hypothetical protein
MNCINCGNEAAGKFCAQCGQRTEVKRISFKEGWLDFWSRVYGFDGMFPRTLRDLTVRPGEVARKYIDGNRAKYYGPVGYFFLMVTLYVLLLGALGIDFREFITASQEKFGAPPPESGQAQLAASINDLASDYLKILFFLAIFFQALAARYFFFRKSGLNFLEHMVLPLYLMGHTYWLSMALAVVYKLNHSFFPQSIAAVAVVLYMAYAYTLLISIQPKWKVFLKGIGIYIGSYILFSFSIFIVVGGVIILLAFVDPSAIEAIRPSNNP